MKITKEELQKIEQYIQDNKSEDGFYEFKLKKGKIISAWHKKSLALSGKNDGNMV